MDRRLPARVGGDGSLQLSTLEAWLAMLAQGGWPRYGDEAERAVAVTKALLESAAAQGSVLRQELLEAAQAVGSRGLVRAVVEALPLESAAPEYQAAAGGGVRYGSERARADRPGPDASERARRACLHMFVRAKAG